MHKQYISCLDGQRSSLSEVAYPYYYSDNIKCKLEILGVARSAIVEAPSGYGKTTAVREFLRGAEDKGDVFWFTAEDEAPSALYRRLCRAIKKVDEHVGSYLLETDFPNAFTIGDVCHSIRSIECKRESWLVIDNFQLLFPVLPQQILAAMLEHGRENLHVIILTQPLGQEFLVNAMTRGIPHITASDLQWDVRDICIYFDMAGAEISSENAQEVFKYTEGWIIAVQLQLRSWRENGVFSDEAVLLLMEHLVWNKMSAEQQDLFMRIFVFESVSIEQILGILGCEALPEYADICLSNPLIRYVSDQQRLMPHAILFELIMKKRREQGEAFERECLINSGDIYRSEGAHAEALVYYSKARDYKRMFSLNLAELVFEEIGDQNFYDIAIDISENCPDDLKRANPLCMLCVAWAVRLMDNKQEFSKLMGELDTFLPKTGLLRAEWMLLSVYLHYPSLENMLPIVKKAESMFHGKRSKVILPDAPWSFFEYSQIAAFHTKIGSADEEADMMEEFIGIYSELCDGHGFGADASFRAGLAFLRCETTTAEILAYKAVYLSESKQQKIIQIGAAQLLAEIAVLKSDPDGWQKAVDTMESAAAGKAQSSAMFRLVLDSIRGVLLAQLKDYTYFAERFKNVDLMSRNLPFAIIKRSMYTHILYLVGQRDFIRLIGLMHTVPFDEYGNPSEHFHLFLMAVGYVSLKDKAGAASCLRAAAERALPDKLMHFFAGFSTTMGGLSEELIRNDYPELCEEYMAYRKQYVNGWESLHRVIIADELPDGLTEREYEIAMLAADGLRNNEIAKTLFVSENTVRAHLRSIYAKLDIDRRAKLAHKLFK